MTNTNSYYVKHLHNQMDTDLSFKDNVKFIHKVL